MGSDTDYVERYGLKVHRGLSRFVEGDVLAPLSIRPDAFWSGLAEMVHMLGPANAELLVHRRELQERLDAWHRAHKGAGPFAAYESFLREIGYLEEDGRPEAIAVRQVDDEIAHVPGPQLVVPLSNARFALNAANARWGSLYDALYGTNVIEDDGDTAQTGSYDPGRGAKVIEYADRFLDEAVPLAGNRRHGDVVAFELSAEVPRSLSARMADGSSVGLLDPGQLAGYAVEGAEGSAGQHFLLVNHGLHIEIVVDRNHPVGRGHHAGVADVILEAAVTTIVDCEDSVAAVDADDKVAIYENWLGLMRGDLEATFEKDGTEQTRRLQGNRSYRSPDGTSFELPGRSLLLIRNVGLHMYSDTVLTEAGQPVPEGMLDAAVTVAIGALDIRGQGVYRNSRAGSIYVVKPKLHGSAEVAHAVAVFAAAERMLNLPEHTVKIGIMDEERRTTLNLAACIGAARQRVIFINTGFLDRTGDEIHSAMAAGPVIRKAEMRSAPWLLSYENHNVDVGLASGFAGVAQIGKGMWARPDAMAEMVKEKIAHPLAGGSCAWVPSPTAATLHAMHYHQVDVVARQIAISRPSMSLETLLDLPLLTEALSTEEIEAELANNAQSILGYVVRWIDEGVGCSKVPDIHNVALMEDRATLRISSQHIANWLHHGLVSRDLVVSTFERMAAVVDAQNSNDPSYRPMAEDPSNRPALQAALELVLGGVTSPNGYTEPVLHAWRRRVKAGLTADR
jgi:malate synthase